LSDETEHRIAASAFFRRSWSLYDAIVESNHMNHREIYEVVSRVIVERVSRGALRMLDLGCGNTRCIEPILRKHRQLSYVGVDLSEAALAEAAELLREVEGVTLKRSDLLEFTESQGTSCDLIFSGFAVHHLSLAEKQRLFRALAAILPKEGIFLMVDVVREEGVTIEEHVEVYTKMMRTQWHGIPEEALEEGCSHVETYDFPATVSELRAASLESGFAEMNELWMEGPHRIFLFSR
jgi:SAM-dependent methyltransferase